MVKKCAVCKRGATKGAKRSHSNVKTLKRQHLNLQTRKMEGIKVKVCTNCLKTLRNKKSKK